MFAALLEARGVERRDGPKGKDNNSVTVTEIATEAGVHPNTARNRMKLADDLEPYPDTAEKVDAGEVKVRDALEEMGPIGPA